MKKPPNIKVLKSRNLKFHQKEILPLVVIKENWH